MNQITRILLTGSVLAPALLGQSLPREDLIGVSFAGTAVTLDSRAGFGQPLGSTGRSGHNCMARVGSLLYTTEQVGSGASAQYFLDTIDDNTGQAFRSVSISRDLRALAPGGQFALMAIAENGGNDQLVSVDVFNGVITVIGATGFGSVQGLTLHNGTFYGWDLNAGLVRIDFLTGAATDVNPSVGTNGVNIQFLTTTSDGRVLGGQNSLYQIDLATGVPTRRGSGQYNDLRGVEERFGVIYAFGQGCGNVTLGLSGTPSPSFTISTVSSGNRSLAAGTMFIGFSEFNYHGLVLPARLDGFLGTVDCFLYTGTELTLAGAASNLGLMRIAVRIPPGLNGLIFHVQHVSLSNAPGGLAFSNGGTVRVNL